MDISKRPWGGIKKNELPNDAFLDPENRRFPYKEPDTNSGKDGGRWKASGAVNFWALVAIEANLQGEKTNIPEDIKKKSDALLRRHKIGKYREDKKAKEIEKFIPACEVYFGALPGSIEDQQSNVRKALTEKFGSNELGKNIYVSILGTFDDFVVFRLEGGGVPGDSGEIMVVDWEEDEGNITLGTPQKVDIRMIVATPMNPNLVSASAEQVTEKLVDELCRTNGVKKMSELVERSARKSKKRIVMK